MAAILPLYMVLSFFFHKVLFHDISLVVIWSFILMLRQDETRDMRQDETRDTRQDDVQPNSIIT